MNTKKLGQNICGAFGVAALLWVSGRAGLQNGQKIGQELCDHGTYSAHLIDRDPEDRMLVVDNYGRMTRVRERDGSENFENDLRDALNRCESDTPVTLVHN